VINLSELNLLRFLLHHLIIDNGKGKLETYFLLQCDLSPGDFSIKPGAQIFQAETLRLRVKPGVGNPTSRWLIYCMSLHMVFLVQLYSSGQDFKWQYITWSSAIAEILVLSRQGLWLCLVYSKTVKMHLYFYLVTTYLLQQGRIANVRITVAVFIVVNDCYYMTVTWLIFVLCSVKFLHGFEI